ncbi:MAG: type II toxin-antitoxin system RelE/ParE family toxin [Treponema sp.]|nr:type II toxin-antitoxin system RelE/ParE family toxin [Treponema sp.]MCL2237712.1 type II toxin-antitoxin system RelE/ParE family toxin [Treponema sp.]
MRIFKYKWFHKFAKKEGITDSDLKEIVKQLENGQFYADLGGGVYKIELARKGKGKHGGYRAILLFKSNFRTFFKYAFPKSERDNIGDKELKGYKESAKDDLTMTDNEINQWLKTKTLLEIRQEE